MRYYTQSFIIVLLCLLAACSRYEKEPLKTSLQSIKLPTEQFQIDTKEAQVLESKNGSVLSIPKGAFLDENGQVWEGEVTLNLVDIQDVSEMLTNHISTASAEGLLKSHAIVQLTATAAGKTLQINPDHPPYIELATQEGMNTENLMVYEGAKDEYGQIKWENPEPAPKLLIPVDFGLLDFYPKGFEALVEANIPYKSYQTATKQLKDSLYFSLHQFINSPRVIETGTSNKYTDDARFNRYTPHPQANTHFKLTKQESDSLIFNCSGIDPAIIKTIQQAKFANTFLATREFAKRLKVLYQTCDNSLVALYINNLDKNLWEVDALVATKSHAKQKEFEAFAAERLTTVKDGAKYAKKLKAYYSKQLKKNQKDLEKAKQAYDQELAKAYQKAQKEINKVDQAIKKKENAYRKVLQKRMTYRLERHGIFLKKSAPYTLCEVLQGLDKFELSVHIPNYTNFDRLHVYVVDPVEKCLFAMISAGDGVYDRGYDADWPLLLWKRQDAHLVVIAYKGDQPYRALNNFQLQKVNKFTLKPEAILKKELTDFIKPFDQGRKSFNKIEVDLKHQKGIFVLQQKKKELLSKEKARMEKVMLDQQLTVSLALKAFPCCFEEVITRGKNIFEANCEACHAINAQVVGPPLRNILRRRTITWLAEFTRYPQRVIDRGDPIGKELYRKYKQYMPNHDFLSPKDVESIYLYIEKMSDPQP